MAVIDQNDEFKLLIISDITKDGAWLTIPETEAMPLEAWR